MKSKSGEPPSKKFKASSAPKGAKLPSGYTDRTKTRDADDAEEADEEPKDERERRLKELTELAKAGKVDMEYVIEQSKLLGGDISSTHLVRGLDFKLLEKVRKGVNVFDGDRGDSEDEEKEEDFDEELDQVLEREVEVKPKEKAEEPPKKKTRAEILAELRKAQEEKKKAADAHLGTRFKKIGQKNEDKKKEEDPDEGKVKYKYITDENGKVKRVRVKKKVKEPEMKPTGPVLGADVVVPKAPVVEENDDDFDIFEGVGTDYDPLASVRDEDGDSDEEEGDDKETENIKESKGKAPEDSTKESAPKAKIKLFDDDNEPFQDEIPKSAADLLAANPELAAALKKASAIAEKRQREQEDEAKAKEEKLRRMIESADRDMMDMDMGFGGTTTYADDDEDGPVTEGTKKRKRGKKKGPGDKNDFENVKKYMGK